MQSISYNLPNFLSFSHSIFHSLTSLPTIPPNKFFFIIGNESSDLDSIIGSISLSYYRQIHTSDLIFTPETIRKLLESDGKYYFPVINCQRSEINSRFDWCFISELMGVTREHLIFYEDLENVFTKHKQNQENLHIILFDHNFPTKAQSILVPLVVEIIDHHEIINFFPKEQSLQKTIKKAGSCCSILTETIEDSDKKLHLLGKPLLFGILSTILLDTLNFDPKLKENRWVQKDLDLFNLLKSHLNDHELYGEHVKDKDIFYKNLINLKYSEKQNLLLNIDLIFTKDLKTFDYEFGKVCFTSIFVDPRSFIKHYGEEKILMFVSEKIKEENLVACLFLFVYPSTENLNDESLMRDLLAFSKNEELLKKIEDSFLERKMKMKKSIVLKDKEVYGISHTFYSDEERVYSRKLLEPIISKIKI